MFTPGMGDPVSSFTLPETVVWAIAAVKHSIIESASAHERL
jgi:hypothetical protein